MNDLDKELDEIFEEYRVLIMNGLGQAVSFPDISEAAENEAKQRLNRLLKEAYQRGKKDV